MSQSDRGGWSVSESKETELSVGLAWRDPGFSLASLFGPELRFTAWLIEHEFELALALMSEAKLPFQMPSSSHQVTCPTGTADIIFWSDDERTAAEAVIEVMYGQADRSHCQRLVSDYMGHFKPKLGILICEQWRPSLASIFHNSLRPIVVLEAGVLLDADSPIRRVLVHFTPAYEHRTGAFS